MKRHHSMINFTVQNVVLEDEVLLETILAFLPDTFRFTASVSKRFRRVYDKTHNNHNRTTHYNALQTVGTVQIWVEEAQGAIRYSYMARELCDKACQQDCSLEVLQHLRSRGHKWSSSTCAIAASKGRLDILKWARANGCPWDTWTCYYAAKNGHLDILIWARANGCPWNASTCSNAAANGHLEILMWARASGCPWDKEGCVTRASQYPDVLKWLHEN